MLQAFKIKMSWRKDFDKSLKPYIERLIRESFNYKKQYSKAVDPGKAQLWIALATISKQLYDVELKLRYLERVLQQISPKFKGLEAERKKEEAKVKEIIKKIARGKLVKPPKPKKVKKSKKAKEKNKA